MKQIPKVICLQLLQTYKRVFSPLFPMACRYVPTCSEYATDAVDRYGAFTGAWMGCARILRCHPFGGSGYDPVIKRSSGCEKS